MIPVYTKQEERKIKKMSILEKITYMEKVERTPKKQAIIKENKIMEDGYNVYLTRPFDK